MKPMLCLKHGALALSRLALCCLLGLGLVFTAAAPQAAQAQTQPKAKVSKPKAGKAKPGKPQQVKTQAEPGKKARRPGKEAVQADKPKLTKEELISPYSASDQQKDAQNASRWVFEPAPKTRPFAAPQEDSTLNLRLGQDKKVDPLTGEEIKNRTDAAGAKEDLKNLNIKGAMDKVGGKAEVQVEILKF